MNNAAIAPKGTSWSALDNWHKVFDVNLFGYVLRTCHDRHIHGPFLTRAG